MRILTAGQMREADRRTIEEIGVPSIVLMEHAGREVAAGIEAEFPHVGDGRLAVVCGRGNNGGDGFVVARILHERGVAVSVFLAAPSAGVRGDAKTNLERLEPLGVPVVEVGDLRQWEARLPEVRGCSLVVDALFGTGLGAPLTGLNARIVEDLNGQGVPIVSIDLPSGLSADTAEVVGPCIRATLTVTLAAPKVPLVLPPAMHLAGKVLVADIGIPAWAIEALDGPHVRLLTRESLRLAVPARRADAHKGDFGHVLVVAGSRGKTGAAHLAAMGALRSGAGLVTVATPSGCQPIVASLGAEYMTGALPDAPDGAVGAGALDAVLALPGTVMAVGPGLGVSAPARDLVRGLVERSTVPLVLDADALNAFAGEAGQLVAKAGRPIVVTPHPGEMARLLGLSTAEVQLRRLDLARDFAAAHGVYVVLKGHRTIVATPDGKAFVNPTGNPGMATGGTGDVLTGAIAGWLAQVPDPETACLLGVYLHGSAGDLAAAEIGHEAMIAGDVAAHFGEAIRSLTGPAPCAR